MRNPFYIPLAASVLALTLTAAARGTEAQIVLLTPDTPIAAGEAFVVTAELRDNPGFSAVQFCLTWEQDEMVCQRAALGDLLRGTYGAANPAADKGAFIAAASPESISGDGTLATFRFRAEKNLSDFRFALTDAVLISREAGDIPFTVVTEHSPDSAGGGNSAQRPAGNNEEAISLPPSGEREEPQTGGNGGGTADSTKPPANPDDHSGGGDGTAGVEVSNSPVFTDTKGNWAEEYIRLGAARGLFGGYSDGTFRPNNQLTRAQFATVLWNLAGQPDPAGESPFLDMAGQIGTFRKAVAWAWERGIVSGTSPGRYAPSAPLTRQAAMKILFQFDGGVRGREAMFTGVYDQTFQDSGLISEWGKAPVYWGVYNEIIRGTSSVTLNPRGTITRSQMAAIMVRYLEYRDAVGTVS